MSSSKKIRKSKIAQWADEKINEVNNRESNNNQKSTHNEQSTPETTKIKDVQSKKELKNSTRNKISTINEVSDAQIALLKKDKEEEFLLQDENNRFVLFPIR